MKLILNVLVAILFLVGCASSYDSLNAETSKTPRTIGATQGAVSLIDFIRQLSGVTVLGSGDRISIRVFGSNSFNNTSEPLFLINGSDFGDDFQSLENTINPTEVKSVSVYKTPSELALYGARGANGVINIILK